MTQPSSGRHPRLGAALARLKALLIDNSCRRCGHDREEHRHIVSGGTTGISSCRVCGAAHCRVYRSGWLVKFRYPGDISVPVRARQV